jgi:natural product biosynthesis luciferase-like monooxygenase protein
MPDIDDLARRLAALDPEARRLVQARLAARAGTASEAATPSSPMDFSVFFFSAAQSAAGTRPYGLVLEASRIADQRGFEAVWTPERHFHEFGGPYPAPAVLAAALAPRTERIQLRAGSMVAPLHDPIRVCEDWAVVDNLSKGRVGLAFASGFHPLDFTFAPEAFASRRDITPRTVEQVRALWRGEKIRRRDGVGETEVGTYPRPVQPELPVWLTGESESTFRQAGRIGANVLTALLSQNIEQLRQRITAYRTTLRENGHDPDAHRVTLMLHSYVGVDRDEVRETVRAPFSTYLRTHLDLARSLAAAHANQAELEQYAQQEEELLEFGLERYMGHASLMGTPEDCRRTVLNLRSLGVDEIGCLVDFGVADDLVLAGIERIADLREHLVRSPAAPVPEPMLTRSQA